MDPQRTVHCEDALAWLRAQDVLAGCSLAAGLALGVDFLIGQIEAGLSFRRPWQTGLAAAAILAGLVTCYVATVTPASPQRPRIIVGAKNFSEQFILARLIGQRLEAKGYSVDYRDGLGSSVAYKAIAAGEIDVYVDYSGTLWTNVLGRTDNPGREELLKQLTAGLKPSYARAFGLLLGDCPVPVLTKCAKSSLWLERCGVAQHASTPAKIVTGLVDDPHPVVSAAARSRKARDHR